MRSSDNTKKTKDASKRVPQKKKKRTKKNKYKMNSYHELKHIFPLPEPYTCSWEYAGKCNSCLDCATCAAPGQKEKK